MDCLKDIRWVFGVWCLGFLAYSRRAMHLLRSHALGTEVIDELDHQIHGVIGDPLIDPDRGKIVAFFVKTPSSPEPLLLQTQDILSWGKRVHIREPESMGPVDDMLRLQPFLQDDRPLISQRIRTKSGVTLGKCRDIQFNTEHFEVEWLFPRKFLKKALPLPASDILEITKEAIIVKDQTPREEKVSVEEGEAATAIDSVIAPAAPGRSLTRRAHRINAPEAVRLAGDFNRRTRIRKHSPDAR